MKTLAFVSCLSVAAIVSLLDANTAAANGIVYSCKDLEKKAILSRLGAPVYQGNDGWFARAVDLETMFEYPPQTIKMLVRLNEVLRSKGTHLIALPMLPRGIAGRDFIPENGIFPDRVYDTGFSAEQYNALIASIRDAGVTIININETLAQHSEFDRNKFYFKRDIHWTPEAARLVAEDVAELIRTIQPQNTNPVQFETTKSPRVKTVQSNLIRVVNELCEEKIPAETASIYETRQVVDSLDTLLDEGNYVEKYSIHVVGSSFTDEAYGFNFNGFLRQALEQNVEGFSMAGGGVTQSFYGWANNASGAAQKPEILIWEFNNVTELIGFTPYLSQVLTPAIAGDCTDQNQIASEEFDNTSNYTFDISKVKAQGSGYYLRYQFSNKGLRQFKLKFDFANGESLNATVDNPSRISDIDKLYHELPDDVVSPVTKVELQMEAGVTTAGTAKLCRYPAGVFSDNGTTN